MSFYGLGANQDKSGAETQTLPCPWVHALHQRAGAQGAHVAPGGCNASGGTTSPRLQGGPTTDPSQPFQHRQARALLRTLLLTEKCLHPRFALLPYRLPMGRRSESPQGPQAEAHQGVADLAGGADVHGRLVTDAPAALAPPLVVADALGSRGDSRWLRAATGSGTECQRAAASSPCPQHGDICYGLEWPGQDVPPGCRCRCRCSWDTRSLGPPSRSHTRRHPWSSDRDLQEGNVTALRPSLGFPSILGCIPSSDLPCPRSPQPVIHPSVPAAGDTQTCRHQRRGQRGGAHRCRGSRRCAGTAGRRTGRSPHQSAAPGPRGHTGTSRRYIRPGPSTPCRPQGGCTLFCRRTIPGSSRTCPLA